MLTQLLKGKKKKKKVKTYVEFSAGVVYLVLLFLSKQNKKVKMVPPTHME